MSADATDPPLCQYDRGYSSVVSTLCQPLRQICHRCVSMTEPTQSVVSTLVSAVATADTTLCQYRQ